MIQGSSAYSFDRIEEAENRGITENGKSVPKKLQLCLHNMANLLNLTTTPRQKICL